MLRIGCQANQLVFTPNSLPDPEWGHGIWKGEEVVGCEQWKLADLNPLDPRHIHVQELCCARMGEREGIGILEQLVIGPHEPSGFEGLFDGAK